MVLHTFNLSKKEIDNLTFDIFLEMAEQAFNIKNFERGGAFELETTKDKKLSYKKKLKILKQKLNISR